MLVALLVCNIGGGSCSEFVGQPAYVNKYVQSTQNKCHAIKSAAFDAQVIINRNVQLENEQ